MCYNLPVILAQDNSAGIDFQELMQVLDESLPVGLFMMDLDGVFLYGNRALKDILEWDGQLIGVSLAEFFPTEKRETLLHLHREQFATSGTSRTEKVYMVNAKGKSFTALVRAAVHQIEEGFNVVIGTIQDVTEEERLQLKRDATDRVVLHDLKNPLSGFLGLAQLLRREFSDETIHRFSLELQRDGMQLLRLMETQLALGRVETDQFKLIPEAIEPATLFEEALADWVPEDATSTRSFVLAYAPEFTSEGFYTNATLVRAVFGQVLRFAFENSPPGSTIAVTLSRGEDRSLVCDVALPNSKGGLFQSPPYQWDEMLQLDLWLVKKTMRQLGIACTPFPNPDARELTLRIVVPSDELKEFHW